MPLKIGMLSTDNRQSCGGCLLNAYHTRVCRGFVRLKENSISRGEEIMKLWNRVLVMGVCLVPLLGASLGHAQTKDQKTESKTVASPETGTQQENLKAYIELLRRDVRQEKAEIMGSVMELSAEDAAKFWPIYSEYDKELTKLNDDRAENIKEYARTYYDLTDAKADELIQKALEYQKQRAELLARTYENVKQALGAITAARFVQIEHQLLLLIDLRIASALPIAEQGS
jgi:hypothetical protein